MQLPQSPKRYRYCEYLDAAGHPAVMLSQSTGCRDKTSVEIYEFDVLAVPYSWQDGILIVPIIWRTEAAGFALDESRAVLLGVPMPDSLQLESLPLMATWGDVAGTVFESQTVIEVRTRGLFLMTAA